MRLSASILLVLVAMLVIAACGGSGDDGPRKLEVASIGKDESGEELDPEELAVQGDRLWMTNGNGVVSVDAATGELATKPQDVGGDHPVVMDIAAGDAGVWAVASGSDATYVYRVDEQTGRPGEPVEVKIDASFIEAGSGLEVAAGNGRVWVTLTDSPVVVSLDPQTGAQHQYDTGKPVKGVAAGAGAGWAVVADEDDFGEGTLVRLDDDGTKSSTDLGDDPASISVNGDDIWVLAGSGAERYDANGKRTADVDLEDYDVGVGTIAAGDDAVWVLAYSDQKLVRINPETAKLEPPPLFTPEEPRDVAVAGGYVWSTANFEPPRRARE